MTTIIINTHDAFKQLVSSDFSERQAESIIKVIESARLDNVATKKDIQDLAMEMKALEYRLINKIILSNVGTVIATVTILRFLLIQG
jgi:hypothetical protein